MAALHWRTLCFSPRFLVVTLLGFSSGLPLALTGSALEARYASSELPLTAIGFVTLVGLPYVLKFLWAPCMDRYVPPLWGRRRGWMLLCQLGLAMALLAMAGCDVALQPLLLAGLALTVAFLSASQDIAIDAYRTDILLPEERGLGMGFFVGAYRAAMLFSGSVGLIMADQIGWQLTYAVLALCMGVGVLGTWLGEEIQEDLEGAPSSLRAAYWEPWQAFMQRSGAPWFLLLLVSYKFGDAFAQKLMTTFFVRGLDFSLSEVGTVNKLGGFVAMLLGLFIGGAVLVRLRLFAALLLFGLCQALSNWMFVLLAMAGHNYGFFVATVVIENLCAGMGSAAFFALIMGLCDRRYSAAQFALLTALTAVPREILGPLAAYLVATWGWVVFYQITFLASIPGLLVLLVLAKHLPDKPTELSAAVSTEPVS